FNKPSFTGPLKTSSERSNFPTTWFFRFLISTVAILTPRLLHDDVSARRARHCSAQINKVVLLIHAFDPHIAYGHSVVTKMTRHAHALDDTRRKCRCTDRSCRPMKHGAVTGTAPTEVMALDKSAKTAALACSNDMNALLSREDVAQDLVTRIRTFVA